jgi:tRNA/rRNA methyltransferase
MQVSFILVELSTPENVGAAARAIKIMGFKNLLLVNPCDHLSSPARWMAHGSAEILENAKVYVSLQEAVSDFDFIVGTTAKYRSVKYDYLPLHKLSSAVQAKGLTVSKIAVVFGREESGLRNQELKLCDLVTTVPMKTTFPSLNLAQAVMLYAWELSKLNLNPDTPATVRNEESFRMLQIKANKVLKETGFDENSAIFSRFLERISFLKEADIHLLHSFFTKLLSGNK